MCEFQMIILIEIFSTRRNHNSGTITLRKHESLLKRFDNLFIMDELFF